MLSGRVTRTVLQLLDRIVPAGRSVGIGERQLTGRRGEEDAYFYLRRHGYTIVARNFRTARHHGEIDLVGWNKDMLCFIEVKTRTTHDVKPAVAAVDRKKRHDLRAVIRDYLQTFSELPQWRFDVITVYYDGDLRHPIFELFQNALLSS